MAERADNQPTTQQNPGRVGERPKTTGQPPKFISKKWLCLHYDLVQPNGKYNHKRLYRLVLTKEVIAAIGLSIEDVRKNTVREFDAVTSQKLISILNL